MFEFFSAFIVGVNLTSFTYSSSIYLFDIKILKFFTRDRHSRRIISQYQIKWKFQKI